jgi:hydroxymethylpyrimidine pyrophosphatase-like HAD family hydrolase
MSKAPIPVILLNGSQLGYIKQNEEDKAFYFEQLAANTLSKDDIEQVVVQVQNMIRDGITNVVLFYYPEDWTKGEIIWTPVESAVQALKNKYLSASSVISGKVEDLGNILSAQPICMIFLLLDVPEEKLMAYQHSRKSNFVTASGTDKLSGTKQMESLLNFDLYHSIGAGDTPMDIFLDGVGLSVHVGNPNLPFKGKRQTILLPGFHEFGDLLFQFAHMQMEFIKA